MTIKNVICDIDGVLMHDNVAVPGAAEFLHRIIDKGMPLVLLTNYPSQTGQDLANRFATAGVDVPDSVFYLGNGHGRFSEASGREKSLRSG
jgi:NagD protein